MLVHFQLDQKRFPFVVRLAPQEIHRCYKLVLPEEPASRCGQEACNKHLAHFR